MKSTAQPAKTIAPTGNKPVTNNPGKSFTNVVTNNDLNRGKPTGNTNVNKNNNNTYINVVNQNTTNINKISSWRRPPDSSDYSRVISTNYSKTYYRDIAVRCDFGYRYDGFNHNHWYCRNWNDSCGCWMFYDAGCSAWYYWCEQDTCYYPCCHRPYNSYVCTLQSSNDTATEATGSSEEVTSTTEATTTVEATETKTTEETAVATEKAQLELPPMPGEPGYKEEIK